ncbi:MAG: site-specific integrase, partial [Devosia sp.]
MTDTAFAIDAAVQSHLAGWERHLSAVRRLAPLTVEAYRRDVTQFLAFLADYHGGPVGLDALAAIGAPDIRAFMAERRNGAVGSRSLAR